ncbi:PqiC family protein [Yoonia sp.]|uniref:PqiC family protein n=1 Tax=Yoonia sp. TaxID=2212373 RepID=UPI002FD9C03F
MKSALPLALIAVLAACAGPLERLQLPPQTSTLELRPLVGSAQVRTVSLPSYAAAEEVARELPGGLIATNNDVLWADMPERGVTLFLTRSLSDILNIDVGPEPWPFVELPDVTIDVRVSDMLAGADGSFRLAGQFFVGGDRISYRNRSDRFDISVPMPDQSLGSISAAQSAALVELSEMIARRLGR